eukprot:TRINITY_DN1385_c1_g1_i1.p1 TRINITY_DN1385_c1_g1~~TRINITY_DN1385_c1_g1_i1.p1  ORF type:complete len:902 (+),score=235.56 TRINITY_DN1385_c1_g1_i1:79-2706(+)
MAAPGGGRSAHTATLPAPSVQVIEERDRQGREVARWERGRLLGKGGFAKCYEVTHAETREVYAVKVIDKKSLEKPKTMRKLRSEIRIHRSLRHEHVVRFVRHFEDAQAVYILLELCRGQTLMEHSKRRGRFSEEETSYLLRQLLDAVRYMHSVRVIHRDLKLGNIMLTQDWQVKVGDFGLAAQLEFDGERKRTVCGTPNYIAPEVLAGSSKGHSYEVDLWSVGVIAYALLVGRPPFETSDVKRTYQRIRDCTYCFPSSVPLSPESRDLIACLLQGVPERRLTLDQLDSCPFFRRFPPAAAPPPSFFVPPRRAEKEPRTPLGALDANRGGATPQSTPRGSQGSNGLDCNAARTRARTGRHQSRPPSLHGRGLAAAPGASARRCGSSGPARRTVRGEEPLAHQRVEQSPRGSAQQAPRTASPSPSLRERPRVSLIRPPHEAPQRGAASGSLSARRAVSPEPAAEGAARAPPPLTAAGFATADASPPPRARGSPSPPRAAPARRIPAPPGEAPRAVSPGAADTVPSPAPRLGADHGQCPSSAARAAGAPAARSVSSQRFGITPEARTPSVSSARPASLSPEQPPVSQLRRHPRARCDAASPAPAPRLSPQPRRSVDPLGSPSDHREDSPECPAADARPPRLSPAAARPPVSPARESQLRVVEYADFTAKYGMAYRLSDDRVGVHYNDGTKMVWDSASGVVDYMARVRKTGVDGAAVSMDQRERCSITDYPETLSKKVTLIRYFRSYMAKSRGKPARPNSPEVTPCSAALVQVRAVRPSADDGMTYVKRYLRTDQAIVFRLSNRAVQVCFHDGAEVMLSSEERCVAHTDSSGARSLFSTDPSAAQSPTPRDVAERIRYTKEIIGKLIAQGRARGSTPTG